MDTGAGHRSTPGLVLLIDDNRADNLYHSLVLEEAVPDARVISVSGGVSALDYLTNADNREPPRPDLILLDLNMPAMTGWDFIDSYVRVLPSGEQGLNVPVLIVLSTTENPDEIRRAENHPAIDGFISKPLNEARLAELLTKHFCS